MSVEKLDSAPNACTNMWREIPAEEEVVLVQDSPEEVKAAPTDEEAPVDKEAPTREEPPADEDAPAMPPPPANTTENEASVPVTNGDAEKGNVAQDAAAGGTDGAEEGESDKSSVVPKLVVLNLNFSTAASKLKEYFSQFGEIVSGEQHIPMALYN